MVNNFQRLNKLFVHIGIGLHRVLLMMVEAAAAAVVVVLKFSTCNNRKIFSRWYIIKLGILFGMSRTNTFDNNVQQYTLYTQTYRGASYRKCGKS